MVGTSLVRIVVSTPRCGRGNRSSNLRQGTVLFFFFFCYSVESTVHTPTLVSETQPLRLLRLRGSDFSHLPWRRSHGGGRMVQKVEFPGPRPLPAGGLRLRPARRYNDDRGAPTTPSAIAIIQLPGRTTLTTRPCAPGRTQPPRRRRDGARRRTQI